MVKKIIDVISKVFYYALIAIEAVVLIFSVSTRLTSNENPNVLGYSLYVIATPSMEGVIDVGDVILCKEITDPSTISEGDIITYQGLEGSYADKLITHQVISVREYEGKYYYITKGVANSGEDPEIDETQLVAKFVYKTVFLSLFYKLISTIYGFILLVIIPIVYIIINEVISMIKEIKEEKKNDESTKKVIQK